MQRSTQNNETYQQEVEYGSGYGYGSTGDWPGFAVDPWHSVREVRFSTRAAAVGAAATGQGADIHAK